MASSKQSPSYLMAVLRIMVGYHFISVASGKFNAEFFTGANLARQLSAGVEGDPLAFHRAFITGTVIPNAELFSYIVAIGEMMIGLSLLCGLLVRISGTFASFHNLNIYLSIAYAAGGAQLHLNRLYIVLNLIFVITAAGRTLGLDGLMKKRFPKSWIF